MNPGWLSGLAGVLLLVATGAAAVEMVGPSGATQLAARSDPSAPHGIAIGPAAPFQLPEEAVLVAPRQRISWRGSDPSGADAARLLADMQARLAEGGFEVIYECESRTCGGFDFRDALPLLPSPEMFVSLGRYAYLALRREDETGPALASLIASPAPGGAYLQLTLVGGAPEAQGEDPLVPVSDSTPVAAPEDAETDIGVRLETRGHAPLDGMGFEAGKDQMGAEVPQVLRDLADWLGADPARRVALVGHSDWTGSAEANQRLSRQRAQAVAAILTGELGVGARQIETHGAGYLAPRVSNATPEGRAANRRVEVVLRPPAE
ncbi:OmpA family protein [Fluviibacterium sp. DFM31]|uniref:OmpA family protein n=1 Tax=Meridianimarinicoccus marinus TaxID=3231483 RepID=A0ABV3L706_9RHOB